MKVLDSIGRVLKAPDVAYGPGGQVIAPGQAIRPRKDPAAQIEAYASWTYAAASVVARSTASVPMHLMAGEDEIDQHPFLDLWKMPCPFYHGTEWRQVLVLHLLLTGNAYLGKVADRLGVVRELWPLPPPAIRVIPDPVSIIAGYEYTVGAQRVRLDFDEVIHLKLPNPRSLYYGMGIVEAASMGIDMSNYIHQHALATFRNQAVPAVWVKTAATDPSKKRLLARMIEASFKGIANANRTLISGSDDVEDIKPISLTPQELDYLRAAEFTRDEVFALFGVHRAQVGMADGINRANAEASDYTFALNVREPLLRQIEDALNAELLPTYDPRLWMCFENSVPEDRTSNLAEADAGWRTGAITRAEFRALAGMDAPEDDIDADVYAIPYSVTLIPTGQGATEHAYVERVTATDPNAAPPGSDLGPEAPAPKAPAPKGTKSLEERKSRARKLPQRYIAPLEAKLTAGMRTYFDAQRRRVVGAVRNGAKAWPAKANEMDVAQEQRKLASHLAPFLAAAYLAGLKYLGDVTGLSPAEPASMPDTVTARRHFAAEAITATTAAQVAQAVTDAQASGVGMAELIAAINAVFDKAATVRAPMIGQLESSGMFHRGVGEGSKHLGIGYKAWITADDDSVCPGCADNEAADVIPADEAFPSGDMEPPELPDHGDGGYGCRCGLLPITAAEAGVAA